MASMAHDFPVVIIEDREDAAAVLLFGPGFGLVCAMHYGPLTHGDPCLTLRLNKEVVA